MKNTYASITYPSFYIPFEQHTPNGIPLLASSLECSLTYPSDIVPGVLKFANNHAL